jgi:hypothetical protein
MNLGIVNLRRVRQLDIAWARGPLRWWCVVLGAALLGLSIGTALWAWQTTKHRQALLRESTLALQVPAPLPAASASDFTRTLGPPMPTTQLVAGLQQACAEGGVTLSAVQFQARDSAADQLGRMELAVTLLGPYAGTKQVLKHIVERYPNVTVRTLRMRRGQAPNAIETSVSFSAWSMHQAMASPITGDAAPGH